MACNTATAAAIHALRPRHSARPLVGLEPALKPAMALSRTGHIGVIATHGAVNSGKFARLLTRVQGKPVERQTQRLLAVAHLLLGVRPNGAAPPMCLLSTGDLQGLPAAVQRWMAGRPWCATQCTQH